MLSKPYKVDPKGCSVEQWPLASEMLYPSFLLFPFVLLSSLSHASFTLFSRQTLGSIYGSQPTLPHADLTRNSPLSSWLFCVYSVGCWEVKSGQGSSLSIDGPALLEHPSMDSWRALCFVWRRVMQEPVSEKFCEED